MMSSTEALDDRLAAAIGMHLQPRSKGRDLYRRIADSIGFASAHAFFPAEGGDWRVLAERVHLKVLTRDPDSGLASYLVRYGPGTSFPVHPQRSVEECMLVSGDLRIGDVDMRPGDLQIAVPGLAHGPLVSQHGALVFVRGILSRVPEQRVG
jgi:anti-sigma factor ChrR (cupin superfamily)